MGSDLRLLIVEDSEPDASLAIRELERAGFKVSARRVETELEMRDALADHSWDMIISDCGLPSFATADALALARAGLGDVPFIVLSGSMDDDEAVEVLRAGANDFLTKSKMARLRYAVERELREKSRRDEVAQVLAKTERTAERFPTLLESLPDGVIAVSPDAKIAFVNTALESLFGYSRDALIDQPLEVLVAAGSRAALRTHIAQSFRAEGPPSIGLEVVASRHDGTQFPVEIRFAPAHSGTGVVLAGCVRDLRDRERAAQAQVLDLVDQQLGRAREVDAIGPPTGKIAHGLINALSTIIAHADLILESPLSDDGLRADVETIRTVTRRGADLAQQLLARGSK